jgi:hypothetical protein
VAETLKPVNMPNYKIEGCTASDAAALARNNMSAYWTDSTWRLNFKNRTLDDIIEQCTKRVPMNLLSDRAQNRHQKVVDTETGAVLGYARWILPDRLTGEWLGAQTPAVSAREEKEYQELHSSAVWIRREDGQPSLGKPLSDIMERLMSVKEYLGKYLCM